VQILPGWMLERNILFSVCRNTALPVAFLIWMTLLPLLMFSNV
jgi:hypothetical protein